jgi:carbonic anhydrase/acetyltransferase-like protein (isoleucine patch superfamily)
MIIPLNGTEPKLGKNVWTAENAVIVGDVVCGEDCTFWFHSVTRGDVNSIRLGNKVNVQDGACLHVSYKTAQLIIGNNVSIGHRAIVHGCTIEDNVLIGMGAIVMDHARIGENSIIAAGSVVLENTIVEPNSLYAGVPAKKIKDIEPGKNQEMITRIANNYRMYASWYENK